ncbi:MAG: tetratricopeptide repeat protein [Candidatus Shapirobacteria bacterium]|nr:tetratricopeptide repeat protein [Candidatus Shapirobacteria bacterium]
MSQKKIKRLRKDAFVGEVKRPLGKVLGVRQIIRNNWRFLLLLLFGVVAIYFNGMHGDFVSDDYATIPQNQEILSFKNALTNLAPGLSNWWVATVFGVESSIPFHIFSLLLYLIVCVLVFIFVYVILDKRTAIFTTILFAVLPIHVEGVSWISGKPYLFNSLTVLLSLILFVLYFKTGVKKYLWTFLFSLVLAFFGERVRSLSLVLLLPLVIFVFQDEFKFKIDLKKILLLCGLGGMFLAVILWPKIQNRIVSVNSGYNGSEGIFYNPTFQYPTAISKYLQLTWLPTDLTLYHTMYVVPVWLNWLILLTYLTMLGWFLFKDRKMFFALAFIFLAAAPSMAPVKVSWLVAERYMFLGSLGFSIFLVFAFQKLEKKFKKLALILFVFLVLVYSFRVFLRNIDWQTNHKLWVNTCQVSPNSHNAWNNIGDDYDKLAQGETTDQGKIEQYMNAIKGFTQSTVVKLNYADAYHNRANIFYKIGRLDLARDSYETAISYGPSLYQTYFSLIQIDLTERKYDLALDHLNKLNQVKPNDPQVAYVAAVVYMNIGKKDEAIAILQQLVKTIPDFVNAKALLTQLTSEQ